MTQSEIYDLLANNVLDSVEKISNWHEAGLRIKRLEGNVGFEGFYINQVGAAIDIDSNASWATAKAVHELHAFTQHLGNTKWNRAIFKVTREGKFNVEFIWDQELQDEVDRYNREADSTT